MTPTEVEVRIGADGTVRPLRFTWRGASLRIAQVGRTWSDEEGEHWLVMTAWPERVFELLRTPSGTWLVKSNRSRPNIA